MKNEIDFIYEYSDLNHLKTRVQILTGEYADTILEFGGSVFAPNEGKNTFVFEYELFQIPRKFANVKLKGNKEFEMFLGHLLIAIIDAKRNDPEELELVKNAEKATIPLKNQIKIDPWFYSRQATVI